MPNYDTCVHIQQTFEHTGISNYVHCVHTSIMRHWVHVYGSKEIEHRQGNSNMGQGNYPGYVVIMYNINRGILKNYHLNIVLYILTLNPDFHMSEIEIKRRKKKGL